MRELRKIMNKESKVFSRLLCVALLMTFPIVFLIDLMTEGGEMAIWDARNYWIGLKKVWVKGI